MIWIALILTTTAVLIQSIRLSRLEKRVDSVVAHLRPPEAQPAVWPEVHGG